MNTFKAIFTLPLRAVNRIKRDRFFRRFVNVDKRSFIGRDGIGKDCVLEGDERIVVGRDTFIGGGSELLAYKNHFERPLDSKLIIGSHVRITARCRITCAGTIRIGDDALFGPDVFITDHNHGMDPEAPGGYSPQDITIRDVTIEEGVWIGQRACILPGVTIGAHSIIGVNSVVTHDIPPFSIAVGSPARVIKRWSRERKRWESV
ncbi:MAG: acyltransferase [Clostridiales bacterium]|nr:acyltransferase [Clostridiales bacterium]